MTDLITLTEHILSAADFEMQRLSHTSSPSLAFENSTILGFVYTYTTPLDLLGTWQHDHDEALQRLSFMFRRAEQKAWNAYAILLAEANADTKTAYVLHAIEEELSGTRKIARAGMRNVEDVRACLLPLIPIQSAPSLEAVDSASEIRSRAQDVPSLALDSFFAKRPPEEVLDTLEKLE